MLVGPFLSLPLLVASDLRVSGPFLQQARQQESPQTVAIRAHRVILRPGEEMTDATILIERGVIVSIGKDLPVPPGARVIEGAVACAGFVDPWSSLGLDPASAADPSATPATRTADALDPWYLPEERREALLAGVTAARVQAGRSAFFAGIGALVHTSEGSKPDLVVEDACVAGSVGVSRGGRAPDPFDRVAEVDRLVGALDKGRRYRDSLLEFKSELEKWLKAILEKTTELEKDFKKAKKQVLEAVKHGALYVSFDWWDDPTDFSFEIDNGKKIAGMGDTIELEEKTELVASFPQEALLNVYKNGESILEEEGDEILVDLTEPGSYRVEAMRNDIVWILSNNIYVKNKE